MLEVIDADPVAAQSFIHLNGEVKRGRKPPKRASRLIAYATLRARRDAAKRELIANFRRHVVPQPPVVTRLPNEARPCPRGHGYLQREEDDYYCLCCGHREPAGECFTGDLPNCYAVGILP
jgi:hypothetical protein